jgi:hypothetical protein
MPSPISSTKRAVERRLNTLIPSLPIAYENISFVPPTGMYLRTQFTIQNPDDPVYGTGYYREQITFQVFVCEELNKGTVNAQTKAEAIRTLFTKGTSFTEDDYRIHVLRTPQIAGSIVTSDRLVIPILIGLTVEVSS